MINRKIACVALVVLLPFVMNAQKRFSSETVSLHISKPGVVKPPILSIESISFNEPSGNNAIDANELCSIDMTVKNSGYGDGKDLVAVLSATGTTKGISTGSFPIPVIPVGSSVKVSIPVPADMNTAEGEVDLAVRIDEPGGFGTDPQILSVSTRPFMAPSIKLVDWSVTADRGTQVKKMQPFVLTLLIQNTSQGDAEDVSMTVNVPGGVLPLSGEQNVFIGALKAGEARTYEYNLIANNNYGSSNIPVSVKLIEKYGKYAEDGVADIKMNQRLASSKITISPVIDDKKDIHIASLTSDVDRNIPQSPAVNPNRFAIVIGNEDYHSHQRSLASESDVAYARHDAEVFAEYCTQALGVDASNMILLTDATAATMRQQIDKTIRLARLRGPQSEIIFYYAGHGFPDEVTREPYIIPVDVSGSNLASGIKLSSLYSDLASAHAAKVSVFMDACFSGGGRVASLMAARGVKVVPRKDDLSGNIVVFSATSSDQVALPYAEEKHGMFTYFLLKRLQESNGSCSYGDLSEYIRRNVAEYSLRVNDKEQVPQTNCSSIILDKWSTWTLK